MRALRFHAARDLRIEEVAEPPGPGPGEVVVRVVTCGICGTDLHEYIAGPDRHAGRAAPADRARRTRRSSGTSSPATSWRSATA